MKYPAAPTGVASLAAANDGIGTIVGDSAWSKRTRQEVLGLAQHSSNVLIVGPNGTGKEVLARAIHAHSRRAARPFIPVDCAAFVSSLFPSHMFGHVKGAFTGAEYEAMGCFRAADGGTLFLDEIGEMELGLQAKLLRVLQERVVVPVGGVTGIPVDVRIIAATNRDLQKAVQQGVFREDLYYRLNVVLLRTAPLRTRPEDIQLLAAHFLEEMADDGLPGKELSSEALQLLLDYRWPGNVRQLKNVLERAVIYTVGDLIGCDALLQLLEVEHQQEEELDETDEPTIAWPGKRRLWVDPHTVAAEAAGEMHREPGGPQWLSLAELERFHIKQTLDYTYHNQTAAARLLGTTPRILAGKIKKYGLQAFTSRRGRPRKGR